jgi:hypothetical protein
LRVLRKHGRLLSFRCCPSNKSNNTTRISTCVKGP